MIRDTNPRHRTVARDVLRWWPVVIVITAAAVLAALQALSTRAPEYTAGTRMVVVPLVQWDEAFLGTSLTRDADDSSRTTATVAKQLKSPRLMEEAASALGAGWTPESVAAAVETTVVPETNLIDITARAADPGTASRIADTIANTALTDRWTTIAAELDKRIALLAPTVGGNPDAGEASRQLQQLRIVRASETDPTLKIDTHTPPELVPQLPAFVVVGIAAVGGLFIGVLVAAGLALLRRRRRDATSQEAVEPALPHNGVPVALDGVVDGTPPTAPLLDSRN